MSATKKLGVTVREVLAMTRYEQLVEVAIPCTHRHFDYFENCQRTAFCVAAGYADFLEYPRDLVVFVLLDQNLSRTEKTAPIDFDVPMVFGDDGFWYFCFRIKYHKDGDSGYMFEYIKLGLTLNGNIVTIRGDTDAKINTTNSSSVEEFFQRQFNDSLARFQSVPFLPSKRIGFVR
jgi:hypothetical protein